MSTADPGRVHHERRWTLEWLLLEQRMLETAYGELKAAMQELTANDLDRVNFDTVWWEWQARIGRHKSQIKLLTSWRANLEPYDPYCHLATVH